MTMRMLIDARHPEETRVAVVNGSRIEEFDFEAAAKKQIKGNVYLAKVTRVEPSLQAAFIDYGGNRHGFLAFSEIHPDYYQIPREDRERLLREERELEEEAHDDDDADDGLIETHDGEEIPQTVNIDSDENGDEPPPAPAPTETGAADDHHSDRLRERRMALRRRYKIQDVIKRRQVLLVQVVKEERGNKGAALTTYLSLAGRYSVLMPNTTHGGGISRKISSATDRRRLKSIMDELRLPPGMAAIVRTAGLARTKAEIRRDFDYLTRLWDDIRDLTLASTAPALIHEDSDLIKRAIRDIYTREIEEVLVEGEDGYRHARTFMKLLMPTHAKKVLHYVDPIPLFQRGQVEDQLNAMFQPTVQLRSGGYVVINQTEALVAIDINSGRSTREHNIEETAYKTNCEAADEIARQLRLRDMAGLIVIDFIDMENTGNVRRVERVMKEALKNDRARIQVGRISSFGLMEMSRQRLRTGVLEASTHGCPMCDGTGLVRSVPSAALAAIRALEDEAVRGRASILTLRAALDVAFYILNRKRAELADIEARYGVRIEIAPEPQQIGREHAVEVAGGPPVRPALAPPVARAPIVEDDDDEVFEEEELDEALDDGEDEDEIEARSNGAPRGGRGAADPARPAREGDGDAKRGRRRRRRRGGRAPGEEIAATDGEASNEAADAPAPARADDAAEPGALGGRRRRRGRRGGRGREAPADTIRAADDAAEIEPAAFEPDDGNAPSLELDFAPEAEPEQPIELVETPEPAKPARRGRKAAAKPDAPQDEVAPVAAPKRGRRKAAETVEAAAAPVETMPDVETAPAPKRARRKPAKAATPAPEPDPAAMTPDSALDATPEDEDAPARAGYAVGGGAAAGEPADGEPADAVMSGDGGQVRKGGWWQRTFGT